jgi:BirA family biotin operon repressor/biotin-[acetyl-CoA-carboxylase] ligase
MPGYEDSAMCSERIDLKGSKVYTCLGCGIMANKVHAFDSLPSTNTKAMELAKEGAPEGTVVVAGEQTMGRGRHGRTWTSHRGGLYLSIVLRPNIDKGAVTVLPLMAGLAVSKAISTSCGLISTLKWPNDVMIGERKVCGIIAESSFSGDDLDHVVLGIGINVNNDLGALDEDVRERSTSLSTELGSEADLSIVYRDLMYILDMQYGRLLESGSQAILDDWTSRSSTIGRDVQVETAQGTVEGRAMGVDGSGALILKHGSRLTRVDNGDVIHLR